MGLYDRDYMREEEPRFGRFRADPWSPTVALLVVLVIIFLIQWVLRAQGNYWIEHTLGLSLNGIRDGAFWQLFTFQFLHGSWLHLLLNGVGLYSCGRAVEAILGRKRLILLYFLSGTGGGILQMATSLLLRQNPDIPVVGASAGISGLLAAFIMCRPDARLIVFPIPVPIRGWTLLWIVVAVSIWGTVFPFGGVAHAAHLGGLLAGGAFVRWSRRKQPLSPEPDWLIPPTIRRTPSAEAPPDSKVVDDDEVNAILEKINAQGIQSLTDRERKVLERAHTRLNKR
jgi:membrane associated rhomboid family serine protease